MKEWKVLAKPTVGLEYWAWEGKLPGQKDGVLNVKLVMEFKNITTR